MDSDVKMGKVVNFVWCIFYQRKKNTQLLSSNILICYQKKIGDSLKCCKLDPKVSNVETV